MAVGAVLVLHDLRTCSNGLGRSQTNLSVECTSRGVVAPVDEGHTYLNK